MSHKDDIHSVDRLLRFDNENIIGGVSFLFSGELKHGIH